MNIKNTLKKAVPVFVFLAGFVYTLYYPISDTTALISFCVFILFCFIYWKFVYPKIRK